MNSHLRSAMIRVLGHPLLIPEEVRTALIEFDDQGPPPQPPMPRQEALRALAWHKRDSVFPAEYSSAPQYEAVFRKIEDVLGDRAPGELTERVLECMADFTLNAARQFVTAAVRFHFFYQNTFLELENLGNFV